MRELRANAAKHDFLISGCELRMGPEDGDKRPTFEINAYNGGTIRPERPPLDHPLVIDCAGITSPDRIAAILDHNDSLLVGQTTSVSIGRARVDMKGSVTGNWTREGEPSEKVVTHAKNGFIWPVSMGGQVGNFELIRAGYSVTVNGKTFNGPLYVARATELRNISFLTNGADQTASARIAASAAKEKNVDFHEWLKYIGFADPAVLSEEQRGSLQAKFNAEQSLAAGGGGDANGGGRGKKKAAVATEEDEYPPKPIRKRKPDDVLAAAKANRERVDGIKDLMVQYGKEYPEAIEMLQAKGNDAIEDETYGVRDFENLCLRDCTRFTRIDNRPRSGRDDAVPEAVLEAALCRAGGMDRTKLEARFGVQTLEASHKRFRHGIGIQQVLELGARANGFNGSFKSDPEDVLYHAMPDRRALRAAGNASTYDISGILGNTLNRFVEDYFSGVDQSAMRMIAATRPVNDFRQITTYSLTGDLTYEPLAKTGELKHGTFSEKPYTNQADTVGKILTLSRKDLINDDIGALTRLAQRLGRGGALALLNVFWTAFINNSTFFTTANGTLDEGTDTVLNIDGLTLGKTNFNKHVDPDGKPLNIPPAILLVPPELQHLGEQLLKSSLVVVAGDADRTLGNANIHMGTLKLAMARELSNATYTGFSATKWYLIADPMGLPVVEIVFLNGVDRPTVEQAAADFDVLGIKMRGYFDFGVGLQEPQGGQAMKGDA